MSAGKRGNAYSIHNEVKLVRGGAEYFAQMVSMIDRAQSFIHLQVYIFDENDTGRTIANALIRAAQRKIAVYALLDGYASQHLSSKFVDAIRDAGVNLSFFKPFFKSSDFYFGRRLHYKVLVTDATECLVAGVNISDRYNDIGGVPAWLDWGIHARGDIAARLHAICTRRWNRSVFRVRCSVAEHIAGAHNVDQECLVRPRINDWVNRQTEITRNYFELLATAESKVIIMSSYFWPSAAMLRAIGRATKRGVTVKLILAGKSDVNTSKYAERYLYRSLFRSNVLIYEYRDNVLHGKMAVCDSKLVTIGSYNVNNISAYASIELNLEVKDRSFGLYVDETLEQLISNNCAQITGPEFSRQNNLLHRMLQYIAYRGIHLIIFLSTFYFRQAKERVRSL